MITVTIVYCFISTYKWHINNFNKSLYNIGDMKNVYKLRFPCVILYLFTAIQKARSHWPTEAAFLNMEDQI